MDIFVYSDESGVLDKKHNQFFVFGGLLFLSREDRDAAQRKYINAEKVVRLSGGYSPMFELKASRIRPTEKGKLYRSLNHVYKFGTVISQERVLDNIMDDKKSKQRHLDYVFKIGVKRLLMELIRSQVIFPDVVKNMHFFVDEHTTATNGIYDLHETLEAEFKRGVYNYNYSKFYPPIFPGLCSVEVKYCNSSKVALVRAADVIANKIYYIAQNGGQFGEFSLQESYPLITCFP